MSRENPNGGFVQPKNKPFTVQFSGPRGGPKGLEFELEKKATGWLYRFRHPGESRWTEGAVIRCDTRGGEASNVEGAIQEVLYRARTGML